MSEADGLKRLTEFLNQTRKQAEQAVDCLNVRISELEHDRDKYLGERDYYKNYAEQLRVENSKKWRLQERDDWKALVDSVQKDRSRLQDDCHRLEEELNMAYNELNRIDEQREREQQEQEQKQEQEQMDQEDQEIREPDAHRDEECNGHHNGSVDSLSPSSNLDGGGEGNNEQHPSDDILEFETEESIDSLPPVSITPDGRHPSTEFTPAKVKQSPDGNVRDTPSPISVSLPRCSSEDLHAEVCGLTRVTSTGSNSTVGSRVGSPRGLTGLNNSPPPRRLSINKPNGGDVEREKEERSPSAPSPGQSNMLQSTDGTASPRVIVRELRKELAKAHAEIDILRKTAATESLAQEQEIARLQEEIQRLRGARRTAGSGEHATSDPANDSSGVDFLPGESPPPIPPPSKRQAPASSGMTAALWSNPFSVLGYFFSYPSSSPSTSSSDPPRTSAQYV